MASRKLSLDEIMALLDRQEEGENDDPMEVITPGSDDDFDAEDLGEGEFEDECDDLNGKQH